MSDDRELIETARAALAREAGDLATREAPRLAAARRQARAAGSRAARLRPWAWGFGGLATAAAGALSLALWLGTPVAPGVAPPVEDLDLLTAGEGVGFYADLDFYLWLAEDGGAG